MFIHARINIRSVGIGVGRTAALGVAHLRAVAALGCVPVRPDQCRMVGTGAWSLTPCPGGGGVVAPAKHVRPDRRGAIMFLSGNDTYHCVTTVVLLSLCLYMYVLTFGVSG